MNLYAKSADVYSGCFCLFILLVILRSIFTLLLLLFFFINCSYITFEYISMSISITLKISFYF